MQNFLHRFYLNPLKVFLGLSSFFLFSFVFLFLFIPFRYFLSLWVFTVTFIATFRVMFLSTLLFPSRFCPFTAFCWAILCSSVFVCPYLWIFSFRGGFSVRFTTYMLYICYTSFIATASVNSFSFSSTFISVFTFFTGSLWVGFTGPFYPLSFPAFSTLWIRSIIKTSSFSVIITCYFLLMTCKF